LAHEVVLGVLLDHDHRLAAREKAAGQDQPLAAKTADHHMVAEEPAQAQGLEFLGEQFSQCLQGRITGS